MKVLLRLHSAALVRSLNKQSVPYFSSIRQQVSLQLTHFLRITNHTALHKALRTMQRPMYDEAVPRSGANVNLSHKQLRYVCEVARLGSIQAATETLHISQSSILAAISIAEDVLGARIFDRRPSRGIQVTKAGERFAIAARTLLTATGEFNRQIGNLFNCPPQTLRVACLESFGSLFVAEVLRRFVAKYGEVEIHLYEGNQAQLREWLENGEVELVITYDLGPSFRDDCTTRICQIPAHALLPSADPLSVQDAVSIAELATRPLVLLDLPQTSPYVTSLFDVLPSRPRVGIRARSYETVKSAVSAGFGVALLNMMPSKYSTPDGPGLVRRPLIDNLPALTLIVADMYGARRPAFVRSITEFVKDLFHEIRSNDLSVAMPETVRTLLDADSHSLGSHMSHGGSKASPPPKNVGADQSNQ